MTKYNKDNNEFNQKLKLKWITESIDEECIQFMDDLGFYLCDKKDKKSNYLGYNAMTTTQLRNVFGEIKRIEAKLVEGIGLQSTDDNSNESGLSEEEKEKERKKHEDKLKAEKWRKIQTEFLMLRPKIAYNAAREIQKRSSSRIKAFRKVFDEAHIVVDGVDAFKNFVRLFEGVIAYHKVYGGK